MITAMTAGILASVSLGDSVPTRSIVRCYLESAERGTPRESAHVCVDCDARIVPSGLSALSPWSKPCSWDRGSSIVQGQPIHRGELVQLVPWRRRPQLQQRDYCSYMRGDCASTTIRSNSGSRGLVRRLLGEPLLAQRRRLVPCEPSSPAALAGGPRPSAATQLKAEDQVAQAQEQAPTPTALRACARSTTSYTRTDYLTSYRY
ncbi:hypothetical protein J3F83DRAFT_415208 [Trichoderma novae-zelandiae]